MAIGNGCQKPPIRSSWCGSNTQLLNQLQPLEARMLFLANNDVIMHRNIERLGDVDDRLRYLERPV